MASVPDGVSLRSSFVFTNELRLLLDTIIQTNGRLKEERTDSLSRLRHQDGGGRSALMKLTKCLVFGLLLTVGSIAVIDCGGGVSIGVSQQCEPRERRPARGTCEDPARESMQVCTPSYNWGPAGCYPIDDTATDPAAPAVTTSDAGSSDAASD